MKMAGRKERDTYDDETGAGQTKNRTATRSQDEPSLFIKAQTAVPRVDSPTFECRCEETVACVSHIKGVDTACKDVSTTKT